MRRVQVGIVGAGPAGLLLAHLLRQAGVDTVVLEAKSRQYLETSPHRIRAGVLEWGTKEIALKAGVGDRMVREGLEHRGIYIALNGRLHRIDFATLVGQGIWVYGQQYLVRDMIHHHLEAGGEILFEHEVVGLKQLEQNPILTYRGPGGREGELLCEFVVGADGSHSRFREWIPGLRIYQKTYPFAWLGILAETRPAASELIYASHERGFALFSMRSPSLARNYLQVSPEENLENWPEERIWEELNLRLGGVAQVTPGPILERSLTPMRSLVVEPMQHGRVFLVGDAAHVVPPTGAKGMNLAFCDVAVLYQALLAHYRDGDATLLANYTETARRHVWQAEFFSYWMTTLLHTLADPFEEQVRLAKLRHLVENTHVQRFLAENYVGVYTSGRYAVTFPSITSSARS